MDIQDKNALIEELEMLISKAEKCMDSIEKTIKILSNHRGERNDPPQFRP